MEETDFAEDGQSGHGYRQDYGGGHIGARLQAARLDQGRELSDIAAQTRVPLRHLTAIEEGMHDNLPALPYTIGFVKSYARAVGMDPDEAAHQFRQETTISPREPTVMIAPIDQRRTPPKSAMLLGAGLVGLVVLIAILWSAGLFGGPNDVADPEFDPLTSETEVATAIGAEEEAPDAAPEPQQTAEAAVLSGPIVVRADEEAWVRIRGGGETLLMRVMQPGETFEVPEGRDDLQLRTGRAGAITIIAGGRELPKLGDANEVIGEVPLTPAGLQAMIGSDETGEPGETGAGALAAADGEE